MATDPPSPPTSYTPPLSPAQRSTILDVVVAGMKAEKPPLPFAQTVSFVGAPATVTTETQLLAWMNSVNSLTADQALLALYNSTVAEGKTEGGILAGATRILDGVNNAAGKGVDSITSVVDFLKLLASAQLWLRVAEVAIGVVLLGVAVAKLSSGAGDTLRKVPGYGKLIP